MLIRRWEMKRRFTIFEYLFLLALVLYSVSPARLVSQVQWIASGGSSHFLGDLGGKTSQGSIDIADLNLPSTRYALSAGLRVHLGPYFALKSGAYYGRLSADDKYTNYLPRKNRNLNFFSPIYGANAMLEAHFGLSRGDYKRFYVFGGIEYFHFNPKTRYNGQVVELQPLGTEGQNFMPGKSPYSLTSWAIPFGFGYKFYYFPSGFLSLELCARKSGTDYIDDASTNYPDKAALLASDGQMAVDLSDRSLGAIPGFSDAGAMRANSGYNDNFFFISVSFNRTIGANGNYPGRRSGNAKRLGNRKKSCFGF